MSMGHPKTRFYFRWLNGAWRVYRLPAGLRRPIEGQIEVAGALHIRGAWGWVRREVAICGERGMTRSMKGFDPPHGWKKVPHHG